MDTNTLISEVAQLYNETAAARTSGNETGARATLIRLRDLLNKELPVETPAEPPKPDIPEAG